MGKQSSRQRNTAVAMAIVLLMGCAGTPDTPPRRTAFPGAAPDGSTLGTESSANPGTTELAENPFFEGFDDALFSATREALSRGDWIAASLALPELAVSAPSPSQPPFPSEEAEAVAEAPTPTPSATALWIRYYDARIALLRGDLGYYEGVLTELVQEPLPATLELEILEHQLGVAELRGKKADQTVLAFKLAKAGGHPRRAVHACQDSLWTAAQDLTDGERAQLRNAYPGELSAWLDLATIHSVSPATEAADSLGTWLDLHPNHDAAPRATALLQAALRDAGAQQLTLLLPLSGPLTEAGDAVARGFLAGWYADPTSNVAVEVLDSRRFATPEEAYLAARERGASVVVGPLGKRQVDAMLSSAEATVPVLALNRPEQAHGSAALLQLSLAPEDEARQLARVAFAEGKRRALLLRPAGVWGDRMERALREEWQALGGQLPAMARYDKASGYSNVVRDALALDASAERSRQLRTLFPRGLETSGRRRADLDAVFLLSKGSDAARALKPLLDYHYAGDLTAYALSTADSGSNERGVNSDLNGLQLLAAPWRVSQAPLPGRENTDANRFDALHALGTDAYHLARRWWRSGPEAGLHFQGLTARLASDGNGALQRELVLAEFNRGRLRQR